MSYVLAIDQGTSSSRAVVFDADGVAVAQAMRPLDQQFPRNGWVEQDPEALWRSVLAAAREAIAASGARAERIAAIGITNQRETTVVWEADSGAAIGNAISWQDRRTADRCEQARADGMAEAIVAATGLLPDPYFSATKLAWLLDQGDNRQRADRGELRFGTVDSFLVWRLTKGRRHATDATNAARTQLFDIERQQWSERLLAYYGLPRRILPAVCDCIDDFGVADAEWFGARIPIAGVAGDQQAALVGQACFDAEAAKCTFGTGCFLIANAGATRPSSRSQLLSTVAYRIGGTPTYAIEGSIFSAGAAIKWLRDKLGLIEDSADTEAAARRLQGDTGGVFVVPAFTGLGAPYWRPDARGIVSGLTLDAGADHIVVATLKSVAFQTADLLGAVAKDGLDIRVLRIDGGMAANDWFCQFLADATGTLVARPANIETTVVGAALLAATGAGLAPDLRAAARRWRLQDAATEFAPTATDATREAWLQGWRQAVRRSLLA